MSTDLGRFRVPLEGNPMVMATTDTAALHRRIASAKRCLDHARRLENVDLICISLDQLNGLLDELSRTQPQGSATHDAQ